MDDVLNRLKALRKELDQRQREQDRLEGSREQLLKSLKERFGLNSLNEARADADRREKELAELESKVRAGVEELEGILATRPQVD